MTRVTWSDGAERDYLGILDHVAADDPDAAEQVSNAIEATADKFAHFATGHPGRVSGTYGKLVPRLPYIIAYALTNDDEVVIILRVIHTARDWQKDRWPK